MFGKTEVRIPIKEAEWNDNVKFKFCKPGPNRLGNIFRNELGSVKTTTL